MKKVSKQTQTEFTEVFNGIISKNKAIKKISNAFSLVSDIAVIYNYFDFYDVENLEDRPRRIFMGNSFKKSKLDEKWLERIDTKENNDKFRYFFI